MTVFEGNSSPNPAQRPTWVETPRLSARPFWEAERCGRLRETIGALEAGRFDDTFDHEAWNRTNELRSVLLLEAYLPEPSPEEIGVLEMLAPLNARVYREILERK